MTVELLKDKLTSKWTCTFERNIKRKIPNKQLSLVGTFGGNLRKASFVTLNKEINIIEKEQGLENQSRLLVKMENACVIGNHAIKETWAFLLKLI